MDVQLLGGFALRNRDRELAAAVHTQRLVAFLALAGPVFRGRAAAALWPDVAVERAHGSLRTALWQLRRLRPGLVVAQGDTLRLGPAVSTDVDRLVRTAAALLRDPSSADLPYPVPRVGELLPAWSDPWIVGERERYRQLQLHLLEQATEELTVRGRYAQALETGLAAVRADPLRESAHRLVITVHLAEGNIGEARRQLRECTRLLRERLGVAPSSRLRELYRACGLTGQGLTVLPGGAAPGGRSGTEG